MIALDPAVHVFDKELVEAGMIYLEVYPMTNQANGDSCLSLSAEEPDYYDISLRNDFQEEHDHKFEWEDLDIDSCNNVIERLRILNPGLVVCWVEG